MKKNISDTLEWRRIEEFVPGDYIKGMGKKMLVTRIEVGGRIVRLWYELDGKERFITDTVGQEYIGVKKEEQY
ncbi:MAG: hypothetical protein AUF64_00305 [Chloroflexi bacterium 13_1_20CM_54_36]|nr:MAG: hypothetical protein AUF64_00305 [Chloroflexi bacterium 13_1_20CM_54_36]OLE51861.1 MAG: hypothetical protein AUG51_20795 [Acidobacteria bacterium 13_1_20CM_3_53_8]